MTVKQETLVCCWTIKCDLCGKNGHWSSKCPKAPKK